jgi:hypothetical protein
MKSSKASGGQPEASLVSSLVVRRPQWYVQCACSRDCFQTLALGAAAALRFAAASVIATARPVAPAVAAAAMAPRMAAVMAAAIVATALGFAAAARGGSGTSRSGAGRGGARRSAAAIAAVVAPRMAATMTAATVATTAIVATALVVTATDVVAATATAATEHHGQPLEGERLGRQTQHTGDRQHSGQHTALHGEAPKKQIRRETETETTDARVAGTAGPAWHLAHCGRP